MKEIRQIPESIQKKEKQKNVCRLFSKLPFCKKPEITSTAFSKLLHQPPVCEHQKKYREKTQDKFPAAHSLRKGRQKKRSFPEKIQCQKAAELPPRNLSIF